MELRNRIDNLSPKLDVIGFYRSKCEKYEMCVAEMLNKLDDYKLSHEQQFNLERRLRDVIDQNENMRQSLSKLREHLFEERESMLQLKSENGRLKLQELEDRKKIHHLLTFRGCSDENMMALFIDRGMNAESMLQELQSKYAQKTGEVSPKSVINFALQSENEILNLRVKALLAELSDRTQFSLHERAALVSEKQILQQDHEMRKSNDSVLINNLTERLKVLHDALYKEIKTSLPLKKTVSVPELYTSCSDADAKKLDRTKASKQEKSNGETVASKLRNSYPSSSSTSKEVIIPPCRQANHQITLKRHKTMIENLQQRLKRSDGIRIVQEQKIKDLREKLDNLERNVNLQGDPVEKKCQQLRERLHKLKARNHELERRRKLENEGFQADIKILRGQLHSIETQLLKFALNVGAAEKDVNFSALEAIERTAHGSSQAAVKLKDLRFRMLQLQKDD